MLPKYKRFMQECGSHISIIGMHSQVNSGRSLMAENKIKSRLLIEHFIK
jgi:hypothetical protein